MSHKSVRKDVLKQVVAEKPDSFATRDVSDDDRVRIAHPDLTGHSHFHAFIGKALSEHKLELGIVHVREATRRGSTWQKRAQRDPSAIAPAAVGAELRPPLYEEPAVTERLGPQSKSDAAFAARIRLHQSWYRARVLRLPCGTGPRKKDASLLGNMLTSADAAAGANFLTGEIAEVALERVARGSHGVEPFRLLHNLLSSQPMCFNLFGPLVRDRGLATTLLSAIVPEQVAEVTRVEFEWAPQPPGEYLDDKTSFDAFIEYRTLDGQLCALGIETKLSEPFSQKLKDGPGYRRWMSLPGAPWLAGAESRVHALSHNQLWRDHLLSFALRHHPRSPYATTRTLVVCHPEDGDCAETYAGYRALLRDDDDSLRFITLDTIIDSWSGMVTRPEHESWLRAFRTRYLELSLSAAARGGP